MRKLLLTLWLIALLACRSAETQRAGEGGAEGIDASTLVTYLREAGLHVRPRDAVSQTFFVVPARVYQVEGDELHVYEYRDEAVAEADAAKISAEGSWIGSAMVTWIAPPHFFRHGRLMALYLGTNPRVLTALQQILGPQFAGR